MTGPTPDTPAGLPGDALAAYRTRGFVAVPRVLDAGEVADLRRECDRLLADVATGAGERVLRRGTSGGGAVADRLDPVVDVSAPLRRLADDARLTAIARDAVGAEARLFKDKLIFKRPGTVGYGAHQEYGYWQGLGYPPDAYVNIVVCIDPQVPDSGPLQFYPGAHGGRLPGPPAEPRDVDEALLDAGAWETLAADAGDVVAFHALTPHRSGANGSAGPRAALFLTYIDARHDGAYAAYYATLRADLSDKK